MSLSRYDAYKLDSGREGEGGDQCSHWCPNGHVMFVHDLYDEEGLIPRACEYADEAAPPCEECEEEVCRW